MEPYRDPFDPQCTRWAAFSELQEGDLIDYWGATRPVIEHASLDHGRVRILVTNEHGGRDIALAPAEDEGTWRAPRATEKTQA